MHAGMRPLGAYDDVHTATSALTVEALSNVSGSILFNIVEPKAGTAGKSPMQRFLEHHNGNGVQHVALQCEDIFETVRRMRSAGVGALGFMPRPSDAYYKYAPSTHFMLPFRARSPSRP